MSKLNQTQVCRELNLTLYVVKSLRTTKILKTDKSKKEIYFTKKSIDKFKKAFNIDDFYTVSQVKSMLEKAGVYDQYTPQFKMVVNTFDFSVSVKNLIKMEKLEHVKFGTTVYITKVSADKTLAWLEALYKELYPMPSTDKLFEVKKKTGKKLPSFAKKDFKSKKLK